ncbi:MAG: ABC transporter permease [Microbacterium sp.]|uniref:ABC transporter permease n=1 Tax=Microbacterium sp. TaxID=51671 RepID=UPI0039E64FD8
MTLHADPGPAIEQGPLHSTAAPAASDASPQGLSGLVFVREWGIVLLLVVLAVAFSIWGSPVFGTFTNAVLILNAAAVSAIFAAAIAIGILSGSLDLSVPGVAALGGVVTGKLVVAGTPAWIAVILGLVLGLVVGVCNGVLTVRGINPLAVTIGMLSVATGVAAVISGGVPVSGLKSLSFLGTDRYLEVPAPVWVMAIVFILGTVFLTQTRDGIRMLAAGGNPEALRRSGVAAGRYRVLGFALSGMLAALGGVVTAASTTSASPAAGSSVLFTGLTAVALSGVSLAGGRGSLPKVLIGALIIASISSVLVIKNVQPYWTTVITGLLLVGALAAQLLLSRAISQRVVAQRGGRVKAVMAK